MPFSKLASPATIDICSDESEKELVEMPKRKSKASPAEAVVKPEKKRSEGVVKPEKKRPPAIRRPRVEPATEKRGRFLKEKFAPHEGHGLCAGYQGLPCVFGVLSAPAHASPTGKCDLCDPQELASLHAHCPERVTHLLKNLDQPATAHAHRIMADILGATVSEEYKARVNRARHRSDPARPKRGPRGKYNKTK